jgi:hypothetical protein
VLIAAIFAQAVKTAFSAGIVKSRDFRQPANLPQAVFRCFLSTRMYLIYVEACIVTEGIEP